MLSDDIEVGTLPTIGKGSKVNPYANYSVKYFKASMDEPGDMLELSQIETKAIRGSHEKPSEAEIVLLDKDKFTFMDKYFIIVKYLEKIV